MMALIPDPSQIKGSAGEPSPQDTLPSESGSVALSLRPAALPIAFHLTGYRLMRTPADARAMRCATATQMI